MCARQLVVVVVRCILCRSVASLRFSFFSFFVFRFVIVVERRIRLLFVATVLASLLTSTQFLFDFVRRLIQLDGVFSFDLLVVTGDLCRSTVSFLLDLDDQKSSKMT